MIALLQLGVPAGYAGMRQADIAGWLSSNEQPRSAQLHIAPLAAGVHNFEDLHGRHPNHGPLSGHPRRCVIPNAPLKGGVWVCQITVPSDTIAPRGTTTMPSRIT